MELGNAIFGHSRGEQQIPREAEWERPLSAVLKAAGCDSYGWPEFENETFAVRGYDWDADCDCGFEDRAEDWHRANPHAPECYDSVMAQTMAEYDARTGFKTIERHAFGPEKSFFSGFDCEQESIAAEDGTVVGVSMFMAPRTDKAMEIWSAANKARDKFQDAERKRLCKERGLTYPNGCAVHCDCYKHKAADEWFGANGHAENCRTVKPNFLFKPTGFRVSWYKYPLRDSYMSPAVSVEEWRRIMRECRKSVTSPAASTHTDEPQADRD